MKKSYCCVLFIFSLLSAIRCSAAARLSIPPVLQDSQQLLLVLSPAWDSFQGTLQLYQRDASNNTWRLETKRPIRVVIGKNGMGGRVFSVLFAASAATQKAGRR